MQVTVEITSGPGKGRKVGLRAGQKVQFGRTAWADFVVDQDDRMSGVHFAVICAANQASVHDLQSTNGTQLNGQYVQKAELRQGDIITAGDTDFTITLLRGAVDSAADTAPRTAVADASRRPTESGTWKFGYRKQDCQSGLSLLAGGALGEPNQPAEPAQLTTLLAQPFVQFLIADFSKAGQPRPEELTSAQPLFDWMPAEIALDHSPLIIPFDADYEYDELVNSFWDNDALVAIYCDSGCQPQDIIGHLRRATRFNARGRPQTGAAPRGVLGYCWPGILSQLLAFRDEEFVGNLLAGIRAVLLEVPDQPGSWQIFGRRDLPEALEKSGFFPLPPEAEPEDSPEAETKPDADSRPGEN